MQKEYGEEKEKVVHLTFNMLPVWNLAGVHLTKTDRHTHMYILPNAGPHADKQTKLPEGGHNDVG